MVTPPLLFCVCLIKVPRWSLSASSLRKVRQDGLVRTVYRPSCLSASGGVELQCWLWLYSLVFTDFFIYFLPLLLFFCSERTERSFGYPMIPRQLLSSSVACKYISFPTLPYCASKNLLPAYARIILAFYHFLCSTISFFFPLYPPVILTMSANQLISLLLFLHRPNLLKAG